MVNNNIDMCQTFLASTQKKFFCQAAQAIIKGIYIMEAFQLYNFVIASFVAKVIKTFLGKEYPNRSLTFVDSFYCGLSSGFSFVFMCIYKSIFFFINFMIFLQFFDLKHCRVVWFS